MMSNKQEFKDTVWDYYAKNGRSLPWRNPGADGTFDPYKILVSELMLQQTQVNRVIPKYEYWLQEFPNFESLAKAPLADVLVLWSGLGYNRRARFLHESAKVVMNNFHGSMPQNKTELIKLPGVGVNTAGAILAYAFNERAIFVETNIRTVYIYHFFNEADTVADKELAPIIESTIDIENPREWYWALMDYGTYLKNANGNYSKNSQHHKKQSKFEGSNRQIRGRVIAYLVAHQSADYEKLAHAIDDNRLEDVLRKLETEKLITNKNAVYCLAD